MSVGECQLKDHFFRFGTKPTQRACARDFLRDWKKMWEGKDPGQSIEKGSKQKLVGMYWLEMAAARRGVGTCRLKNQGSQCERMSQRSWWLYWIFACIHAWDSQMHTTLHESVTNFSLIALGTNPSPCLFVLLFFHSIGCVCCILCICKVM